MLAKTSTSSLWRTNLPLNSSPRPSNITCSFSCKTTNQQQQGFARELAKDNQHIIGMKNSLPNNPMMNVAIKKKANLELKYQKLTTLIKLGQGEEEEPVADQQQHPLQLPYSLAKPRDLPRL
ncbi:hypothetical protein VP01_915g1 [Puccinia sorghi]|uniref:Uncharacterized protein n=1 Tax=Puccinia sorghi TaxID=27349 RepID=A0A0L6U7H2_9BASI|nr:hypothetical protein VP01_915g1 [Puccinia sorghi]